MAGEVLPKFLKAENLVVGLFGLLVAIAGVNAERMIAAQRETNEKISLLTDRLADLAVAQASLQGRVAANDERIVNNRLYILNVDNRVRELEIGRGRKLDFHLPSAPTLPPVRKIHMDAVDRPKPIKVSFK